MVVRALAMSRYARQMPPPRPPSVAIHNHGYMSGQTAQVQFFEQECLFGRDRTKGVRSGNVQGLCGFGISHGNRKKPLAPLCHKVNMALGNAATGVIPTVVAVCTEPARLRRRTQEKFPNRGI